MDKLSIARLRERLTLKQRKVEAEIKAVVEDDPMLADNLVEASEAGTDSWNADAHTQLSAVKHNLTKLLGRISKALINIQTGRYGKCEMCGQPIELGRLKVMPESVFCIVCSKKTKV